MHSLLRTDRGNWPTIGARDHATLAILPIASTQPKPDEMTWDCRFSCEMADRHCDFHVQLMRGKEWPTPEDEIVYLACLQIGVRHGCEPVTCFGRDELFDLLGWEESYGDRYDRMRRCMRRLIPLTIFIQTAIYSRSGKPYRRRGFSGDHLIDSFEFSDNGHRLCRLAWGGFVLEAFELEDFKLLEWPVIRALHSPTAVRLYRLIDYALMGGASTWSTDWRSLAHTLGLSPDSYDSPSQLRKVLTPHLAALIEQGVIESYDYARGGHFTFRAPNKLRAAIRAALVESGVSEPVARKLLAEHGEGACIIHLMAHRHRMLANAPINPPAHLVSSIQRNYTVHRVEQQDHNSFTAIWDYLGEPEREAYQHLARHLRGANETVNSLSDPACWTPEARDLVRFFVSAGVEGLEPPE